VVFIWAILIVVVLLFSFTVFFGPPYVRSHKQPVQKALDLFELGEGDHLLDMGSGDGAILLAAAKRGARCTGYELSPLLWLISKWRRWQYRDLVDIRWGDMWKAEVGDKTQNVYMFLDSRFPEKLDEKLSASGVELKLVLYSFELPNKKPIKRIEGMNLYEYKKNK